MFRPNCLYCGASASYYKDCDVHLSTIACENQEHRRWAKRDAFAWLHRHNRIRRKDYEKEPLFCETSLLTDLIKVRRTNGDVESDWRVQAFSYDNHAHIARVEGIWSIPACKPDVEEPQIYIQKYVPLESLKMSLLEYQHVLVDDLLAKLDAGLYTEAAAAHDAAAVEQASMDAAVPPAAPPVDYIETRYHSEHGMVRVFNPPL
jgi:hypothetical protein